MDGVEVKSGTAAAITCKITGLTANEPLTVTWLKENGDPITGVAGVSTVPAAGTDGKLYSDYVMIKLRSKRSSPIGGP